MFADTKIAAIDVVQWAERVFVKKFFNKQSVIYEVLGVKNSDSHDFQ